MALYKGIDSSKPVTGDPTTDSVRVNFDAIIDELQVLAAGGGGGAETFLELTDTPGTYLGNEGKLVKVDPTGSFLIYGDPSGSSVSWGDILGTLSNQTDLQAALDGKAPLVHTHVVADITDFDPADYLQNINGESIQDLSDVSAMSPAEGDYMGYNFSSGLWEVQDNLLKNTGDTMEGALYFATAAGDNYGLITEAAPAVAGIYGDSAVALMGPAVYLEAAQAFEGAFLKVGVNGLIAFEEPAAPGEEWTDNTAVSNNIVNNVREDLNVLINPGRDVDSGSFSWHVNMSAGNAALTVTLFAMVAGVQKFASSAYTVQANQASDLYGSFPFADDFLTGGQNITLEALATWSGGGSATANTVDIKLTESSAGGGGGASTFTDLTDTPADYTGQAGKLVKVDPTGAFLIFGDPSGTTVSWGDIQGTLSAQTDLQNALDLKSDNTHVHSLAQLSDTTITSIVGNEILQWSGSQWINRTLAEANISSTGHNHDGTYLQDITGEPMSDLSDVNITSVLSGEILKWSGSNWVNNTLAEAGISASGHNHDGTYLQDITGESINDLSDVSISGVASDEVLTWTGSNWANASVPAPAPDSSKLDQSGGVVDNLGETGLNRTGGTATFDVAAAQAHVYTVNQAATFTFANPTNQYTGFRLTLSNGNLYAITWPSSIRWPGGAVPSLNSLDQFQFTTDNTGATWIASYSPDVRIA